MIIAVDFDGTCVEHMFPEMGPDVPGAVNVLKELTEQDHLLILWTMRDKDYLGEALRWFREREITLLGSNKNPKAYAHLYIGDAAIGCPLIPSTLSKRMMVDWIRIRAYLYEMGVLAA